MANLVTFLVVSGASLFFVFWIVQAFINRRKGLKTPFLQLLIPLILIGLVVGVGYLVTGNAASTGVENFRSSQDGLLILQGGISLVLLALGTLTMMLRRRQ